MTTEGELQIAGTQRIGWDPIARRLRTWVFDVDGSFGEGYLTRDGDRWIAETLTVIPDGVQTTTTNVYTPLEGDGFLIEPIGEPSNGEPALPKAIHFKRRPGS